MTRFVASQDGVPIAYRTYGAGARTLVLIHGWSCDRSYWAAQVECLSRDFAITTLDLGGHGESGTGRRSWTIELFGQDVAAVVEAADLGEVVLVGHSMGGNVAVAAAQQMGDRVKGVVLVDTYRKLGAPRSVEEIQTVMAPFRANFKGTTGSYVRGMFAADADRGLVQYVAEDMTAAPPDVALSALEHNLTFARSITETFESIKAPLTAINSEVQPTDMASLEKLGIEVLTMRGAGHFLMMEDPQTFNDLLQQAVSEPRLRR